MTLVNKLSKAVKLWGEHHYLEMLSLIANYVPGRMLLFKRYYLLRVRRRTSVNEKKGLGIRLGTAADIERLVMLVAKREDHLEAFRKDHFCVVAEAAGKIIGYEYCHAGPSHYEEALGYRFDLGPRSFLCYDAYVHPDYRNKGVWRAIQTGIINLLGDSCGFYALVNFTNHISLKAHLRYGFEIVRQFTEIDLLGLRLIFEKPFSRVGLVEVNRKLSLCSGRGEVA